MVCLQLHQQFGLYDEDPAKKQRDAILELGIAIFPFSV